MTTIFGCDLASYQTGINLGGLLGLDFVLAKVTEGTSYVDPDYAGWRLSAAAAGKAFVWYHFLTTSSPASAQAAFTKANVGDPALPGMLDVETEGDSQPTLPDVLAYIDAAASLGLRVKLVYLPQWYWERIGSPDLTPLTARGVAVVSSAYPRTAAGGAGPTYAEDGGDAGEGWNPYGGVAPMMWQFADDGPEEGQKIDFDAYRGSVDELAAFLGTAAPESAGPPWPGRQLVYTPGRPQMAGTDVHDWQSQMQRRGWNLAADGQYGPISSATCLAFQRDSTSQDWPLAEDSIVGPNTWAATWRRPVSA